MTPCREITLEPSDILHIDGRDPALISTVCPRNPICMAASRGTVSSAGTIDPLTEGLLAELHRIRVPENIVAEIASSQVLVEGFGELQIFNI